MAPFLEGLESWAYDLYLDRPYYEGDNFNLSSPVPEKLHTVEDIIPSWSLLLKQKKLERVRTPSFGPLSYRPTGRIGRR